VVTVIDGVVSPVFHNNDPLNPDAVRTELPQLFATVTTGAAVVTGGGQQSHRAKYCGRQVPHAALL
jgi:hypothetical protein